MKCKIKSYCEQDTIELANDIANNSFKNMVICLNGDLGSGKTLFTKGFAKTLGIIENITSPTFTIIKEYKEGKFPLYHMDVYRLTNSSSDIGITEYYNKDGISIIEWAEIINDILPTERLDIEMKIIGENKRLIILNPIGDKYKDLCEAIL